MYKNRIKELREEKKMTQTRLSIELEVSQETISAYEIGKHYPSVKSLMKMSSLFDASIDYILGITNNRYNYALAELQKDDLQILSLYHRLDHIKKEKALSYLEGLIDS